MRILQINPIQVNSFARHCDNIIENSILVGKSYDCIYFSSELTFPPFFIEPNESIVKATLKMYCKKVWGNHIQTNICINNENISTLVSGKGNYEWDVTNILKNIEADNFKLCAFTKDQTDCCSIKEFEPLFYNKKPLLELFLDKTPPEPSHKFINIIEECTARELLQYSNWIDCSTLNQYTYFIQNLGNHDVKIETEVSPDKTMLCKDTGPFLVKPNEVIYQQPLRAAQFLRISYKNVSSSEPTLIKVWYQGKES